MSSIRKMSLAVIGVLLVAFGALGLAGRSASAEVLTNTHFAFAFNLDNPCESGSNQISLTGDVHMVWYTTPEGTVMMRYNYRYSGTDPDGTRYILNGTRTMEHWDWPNLPPFSDQIVRNLISKGGDPDASIVLTIEYSTDFPAAYVTSVECRP